MKVGVIEEVFPFNKISNSWKIADFWRLPKLPDRGIRMELKRIVNSSSDFDDLKR